ncbi:hypothetical protein [Pseudomonas sp. HLS-6 TE3448]
MLYEGLAKNSTLTINGLPAEGSCARVTQALSALPSCFDGRLLLHAFSVSSDPIHPQAGLSMGSWPWRALHKRISSSAKLAVITVSTTLFQPNIQPFTANRALPCKAERHSCISGLIWCNNKILTNL